MSHDQKGQKGPKWHVSSVSREQRRLGSKITSPLSIGVKNAGRKTKSNNRLTPFPTPFPRPIQDQHKAFPPGPELKTPVESRVRILRPGRRVEYLPCSHCALMVTGDTAARQVGAECGMGSNPEGSFLAVCPLSLFHTSTVPASPGCCTDEMSSEPVRRAENYSTSYLLKVDSQFPRSALFTGRSTSI